MFQKTQLDNRSVDDILEESIEQEEHLLKFYQRAIESVGPDAEHVLSRLYTQQFERLAILKDLLVEIEQLRELSVAMVD